RLKHGDDVRREAGKRPKTLLRPARRAADSPKGTKKECLCLTSSDRSRGRRTLDEPQVPHLAYEDGLAPRARLTWFQRSSRRWDMRNLRSFSVVSFVFLGACVGLSACTTGPSAEGTAQDELSEGQELTLADVQRAIKAHGLSWTAGTNSVASL